MPLLIVVIVAGGSYIWVGTRNICTKYKLSFFQKILALCSSLLAKPTIPRAHGRTGEHKRELYRMVSVLHVRQAKPSKHRQTERCSFLKMNTLTNKLTWKPKVQLVESYASFSKPSCLGGWFVHFPSVLFSLMANIALLLSVLFRFRRP